MILNWLRSSSAKKNFQVEMIRFLMKLECLIENCVVGRPSTWRTKNIFGNNGQNADIVNTEGKFWSEQRRFSLKHLKDLGFGRKSLDSVMVREVDFVIDQLLESKDGIVEMRNTFNVGIIFLPLLNVFVY